MHLTADITLVAFCGDFYLDERGAPQLDIIIWLLIIAFFITSFIGLLYPIIPSVLLIWLGVLLYHFAINSDSLSLITWIMFAFLTVLLFLADYLVNMHVVEKAGASKWGKQAAIVGLILGSFIFPPFGIIFVPFIFVLVAEILHKGTIQNSFKIAFASLFAFLGSTIAKGIIQLVMIIIFVIDVII